MTATTSALVVSTALAWVATANAAPFAVGRARHVTRKSTGGVHAAPPGAVDHGADVATDEPLVSGGLVINATFDQSITHDPKAAAIEGAINRTVAVYQALFKDPITVSILFRYSTMTADGTQLAPKEVSVSESGIYIMPSSTYVDALKSDATSANDATGTAHLPRSPLTTSMAPSSANGRAVGLDTPPAVFANGTVGSGGSYDGIVTLNSTEVFDFVRPPAAGAWDAQQILQHEIDEVLGVGSSLDTGATIYRPEDIFSWSSAGVRNVTTSGKRYFSIDGGVTNIIGFNQDPGGDFGDWASAACPQATPHVQDAFTCTGQALDVMETSPEGIDLDVIGYDTSASTTPTTTRSSTTTTLPCTDVAEAIAVRAAIEAQCDCAGASRHGTYVRCATQVAKSALESGMVSKKCKVAVVKCAARSACGKPGFVTCCRTTAKGKTTCSIKRDAAHCKAPKGGSACPGQQPSCCDACGPGGCFAPSGAP